jgi:hypothetical protein
MLDYQIQPNTRRCAQTGRELLAGERYFAVLFEEGDRLVRQDYGAEAWQGSPPHAFSFWTGRVPAEEGAARPRFDDDMLMDCFTRLESQTEPRKVSFRYVVALLLLRRKRLKLEQTLREGGQSTLTFRCPRSGAAHQVTDPGLTEDELERVQEDVFEVLGWS